MLRFIAPRCLLVDSGCVCACVCAYCQRPIDRNRLVCSCYRQWIEMSKSAYPKGSFVIWHGYSRAPANVLSKQLFLTIAEFMMGDFIGL